MRPIFCFAPGQSAQYVGMGSDLYDKFESAKSLYDKVKDITGIDVARLSFNGPFDELTSTDNVQPILLAHSLACFRVFSDMYKEKTGDDFDFAATGGASLGEYFGVILAGVLGYEDTFRLVQKRGEFMKKYGSGRQALITLPPRDAQQVMLDFNVELSNCNYSEQTVIGGLEDEIEKAIEFARSQCSGPKKLRTMMLPTDAAFHTSLMADAQKHYAGEVDGCDFSVPSNYLFSNVTGLPYRKNGFDIRSNLTEQVTRPVQWQHMMNNVLTLLDIVAERYGGTPTIIEFGGGKPQKKQTDPATQQGNFSGIIFKNIAESGRKPNEDVRYLYCGGTGSISDTVRELTENEP
ncbi:MAG: ACP S-malonyltransferase [Nanoarchaeota archaeon]|nr:ACP S-malonyltransferase [Nanoarchaeota archaeon]MBU1946840.1 ACP S-malonyltransferase [Nanoarchaeota archaeon]